LPTPYANFDRVELSVNGGTTWASMTGTAGAHAWLLTLTVSGHSYTFLTNCGTPVAGDLGLKIHDNLTGHENYYPADSYSPTYPATWTFPTVAGSPSTWSGATILIRSRCSGTQVGFTWNAGSTAASLGAAAIPFTLPGDSLLAIYYQNGTDISGGTLATPTIPSGWTSLVTDPNKHFFMWWKPNTISPGSFTVSGIGSADLQDLFLVAFRTRPSTAIVTSNFVLNHAAATALSAGSLVISGDDVCMFGCFNQIRNAGTSLAAPIFSGLTATWTTDHGNSRQVAGGTPIFETLAYTTAARFPTTPGTYSLNVTSNRSEGYSAAMLAFR
jgi:hypothetical protein